MMEDKMDKKRQEVDEHKYLEGMCFRRRVKPDMGMFPEMWRYYKVISARAESSCRVSCLIFDEEPWYYFHYNANIFNHNRDYFEGKFDFNGVYVEDIMISLFTSTKKNKVEKVTPDEYKEAMANYCDKLLNLKWCADHYRQGGKLPIDDDWEVKS